MCLIPNNNTYLAKSADAQGIVKFNYLNCLEMVKYT